MTISTISAPYPRLYGSHGILFFSGSANCLASPHGALVQPDRAFGNSVVYGDSWNCQAQKSQIRDSTLGSFFSKRRILIASPSGAQIGLSVQSGSRNWQELEHACGLCAILVVLMGALAVSSKPPRISHPALTFSGHLIALPTVVASSCVARGSCFTLRDLILTLNRPP